MISNKTIQEFNEDHNRTLKDTLKSFLDYLRKEPKQYISIAAGFNTGFKRVLIDQDLEEALFIALDEFLKDIPEK